MADAKGIVIAFGPLGKSRQALVEAVGGKVVAPPGQDFVTVGLMAYIPHQLVVGRIENVVQGHGELHYPQAGSKMAAIDRYIVDDELPKFVTDLREQGTVQLAQIVGRVDASQ